jgi:hypothetical protein
VVGGAAGSRTERVELERQRSLSCSAVAARLSPPCPGHLPALSLRPAGRSRDCWARSALAPAL